MSNAEDFTGHLAESITGVAMVWAQTPAGVIGREGDLPWHLPEDLRHFSRLTQGHPVLMGRKTWLSFPEKYRPLPKRTNIVITRNPEWAAAPEADGAVVVNSIDEALIESRFAEGNGTVWVLGGGEIFRQAMPLADSAVVTVIDLDAEGDTYAPQLDAGWTKVATEPAEGWLTAANGTRYKFIHWTRTEG